MCVYIKCMPKIVLCVVKTKLIDFIRNEIYINEH